MIITVVCNVTAFGCVHPEFTIINLFPPYSLESCADSLCQNAIVKRCLVSIVRFCFMFWGVFIIISITSDVATFVRVCMWKTHDHTVGRTRIRSPGAWMDFIRRSQCSLHN